MAPPRNNPEKKGKIFKNEPDDPEIDAIALKMKENHKKYAEAAAAKNQVASRANFYINRFGKTVTVANTTITTNNPKTLHTEYEDVESVKGRFAWSLIAEYHVPYIIRVIKGVHLMFVSVRMAETQLLSYYLHCLKSDIYISCTSIKSYFITDSEAKLLNEINQQHVDSLYGPNEFFAGKDIIVRLEDVREFYTFMEVCYKRLLNNNTPGQNRKCGFIRINHGSVVPYCTKDGQKHVPLFYFEGDIKRLQSQAIKIDSWDLTYLKFCCTIQGIRNELFSSNSCTVVDLDIIKLYYPPESNFDEYWPPKVLDTPLLPNQSKHVNPPGVWIKAPPEGVPTENNISRTSTAPAPIVTPPVNSNSVQAQPPSTTSGYSIADRNKSMAAKSVHSNSRPTTSQGSNLTNSAGNVAPRVNAAPLIGQRMDHPINQMILSNPSQMQRTYAQLPKHAYLQQLRLQHIEQQRQTTLRPQQPYNRGQFPRGRLTITHRRSALRNGRSIPTPPASEIIDLSSPPSSPASPDMEEASLSSAFVFELVKIPERVLTNNTSQDAPYKIEKNFFQGKILYCINSKPYVYADFMVTVDDLVREMLPFCSVSKCAHFLNKYLETTLFSGNSEQLILLRENGRLKSVWPDGEPMVLMHDVYRVFDQLKKLVSEPTKNKQQRQYVAGPSKRQHNS